MIGLSSIGLVFVGLLVEMGDKLVHRKGHHHHTAPVQPEDGTKKSN